MITFSKQENGVLFTFENSDKYLYGDGTILVPFNSLAVIQDESDMITLRKSASWDIFLSGRFDTDFGFSTKQDAVDALKEALFDETGGGVTEEEVEQMIDAATSGIPSSQVIEQLRTDVNAVSGEVASKADESSLTAVNDALTAHTANTNIHVTSTDKSNWDAKQDALTAGDNIIISGNVISAEAGNNIIELTQAEYDALVDKDPDALYIITDASEINMNDYATKTDLAAKADTSAVTAVNDVLTAHTADTSIHVTSAEKTYWNNKLDASAYTPTDLSNYYTKQETNGVVNAASSGKADTSAVTAVANDVQTVSGQVATKVETSDFSAFSAATDARIAEDEEVTAAALNDLAEGKQDTLISGENIKTINNISILGAGNITVSGGGGGGDYQYYSEDTTNESATIEVGEQSLTVDGDGVYVNNSPVVTAEELDDNYYTQQVIDEKEEVIASALTELNLRVTEDEEVTAAALNDLDEKISTAGGLFVNFDDLMNNMNDEKWDELVNALQNNKPIFAISNYSEGNITNIEQYPVDGYVYIDQTEGEESANISLRQLYNGGYYAVDIVKNGSDDYEVIDEGFDYQPMLEAGSGISIDDNVISVTGGSSVTVDSALTSNSINAVENRAIYDKVTMEVGSDTIEYDSEPVTATTSGSRYYKVVFNDPDQVVTFTIAGLPDTIKLDGNTGQLTYTNGGAIPSGVVTSFTNPAIATYEVAFGYDVASAVATSGGDIIYVGHKGTTTEWVKDVVADLLDDVETISGAVGDKQDALSAGTGINISNNVISTSGVVFSQTVTQLVKLTQAAYDALITKDANTLYIISD